MKAYRSGGSLSHRMQVCKCYAAEGQGCLQDIADEVDGENVLIVTHGDAVNSSVSRLMPWTIVYPVLHTGFTIAYRDQHQGAPAAAVVCFLVFPCLSSPLLRLEPSWCLRDLQLACLFTAKLLLRCLFTAKLLLCIYIYISLPCVQALLLPYGDQLQGMPHT